VSALRTMIRETLGILGQIQLSEMKKEYSYVQEKKEEKKYDQHHR